MPHEKAEPDTAFGWFSAPWIASWQGGTAVTIPFHLKDDVKEIVMRSKMPRVVALLLLISLLAVTGCSSAAEILPTQTSQPTEMPPTPTPFPTFPTRTPTTIPTASPTLRPSATPFPTFTPVPSLTKAPTLTPTPGVIGVNNPTGLLMDDFSDTTSGWKVQTGNYFSIGYEFGGYRVFVSRSYMEAGAARGRSHANLTIRADAVLLAGVPDAYYGITCREEGSQKYTFALNGAGEWRIYLVSAGRVTRLAGGQSDSIKTSASAVNHLEASCLGTTLLFSINGVQVGSATDVTLLEGSYAGLTAGTLTQGGVDVLFDNVVINPNP